MEIKKPREKDKKQALSTLMERSAKSEMCVSDAERLLFRWSVPREDWESIIERLVADRFIDQERYAFAFVRDKMQFSGWGRRKIEQALRVKRVDVKIIAAALEQIEDGAMDDKLQKALKTKLRTIRDDDPYKVRDKLLRFGISRGFDFDDVREEVDKLIRAED